MRWIKPKFKSTITYVMLCIAYTLLLFLRSFFLLLLDETIHRLWGREILLLICLLFILILPTLLILVFKGLVVYGIPNITTLDIICYLSPVTTNIDIPCDPALVN